MAVSIPRESRAIIAVRITGLEGEMNCEAREIEPDEGRKGDERWEGGREEG